MSRTFAIIVAAGRGARMNADQPGAPKQYLDLAGETVLQRTISCFTTHPAIDAVIVVIHADDGKSYEAAVAPHPKLLPPVKGGATRQESCYAGIAKAAGLDSVHVLIHDAARPFLDHATIDQVLAAIQPGTGAVPGTNVSDTIRQIGPSDKSEQTLDRNGLRACQTPQGFITKEILTAHRKAADQGIHSFTDDAAVFEWAGHCVEIVQGNRENIKITTPSDLEFARFKLQGDTPMPDVRTGHGYDTHRLEPGDRIILCGVEIEHEFMLSGHSDADIGLHALTDALLGAIGDGDIGAHFPPTDPKWKGASSDQFLAHAVDRVTARNGNITHMDVTLICEAPKIAPHREAMRQRIAEICGTSVERVSVKATTNEKQGFIGRNEGLAALATATVVFPASQDR